MRYGFSRSIVCAMALAAVLASAPHATVYHVATNGNNATGDGSAARPWATLSYAATKAVAAGDTIRLGSGTFVDSNVVSVSPGVSACGSGKNKTIIKASIAGAYLKLKTDVTKGGLIDGNQSVHDLTIDGCAMASAPVQVCGRNNVSLYNLRITSFSTSQRSIGIMCQALKEADRNTAYWMSGLEIYNCTVDCVGSYTYLTAIITGSQIGAEIHDNEITMHGGGGIGGGPHRKLKVYNNKVSTWGVQSGFQNEHFPIEIWYLSEDTEIFGNTVNNGFSLFSVGKRTGKWGLIIHDNTIVMHDTGNYNGAVLGIECSSPDLLIYNNFIAYASVGIGCYLHAPGNVLIHHNTILGRVHTSGAMGTAFCIGVGGTDTTGNFSNIRIFNNTLRKPGRPDDCRGLINIHQKAIHGLEIKNNVFLDAKYGIDLSSQTEPVTLAQIDHNVVYHVTNFIRDPNAYLASPAVSTNDTVDPGFTMTGAMPDPFFCPLSSASFVVNKGAGVGLPFSGSAPDIGAYEYQTPVITQLHSIRIGRLQSSDGFWYRLDGRYLRTGGHEQYPGLQLRKGGGSDGGSVAHLTLEKHH